MATAITLRSTSREEDAALDALADLARAVADWNACRVVGGHMVTIHVARTGADVRHRPTADADLAAPVAVLADPEFAQRLNDLGYNMVDGSRLLRPTEHGEAFIDLIAPAPASRALHNQPAGRFRVDPESVKRFETGSHSFWMGASREGSLIHATVGSRGGVGRRWRKRAGLAA